MWTMGLLLLLCLLRRGVWPAGADTLRRRSKRVAAVAGLLLLVPTAAPSGPSADAHPLLPIPPSARPVLSLGDEGLEVEAVQRRVGVAVDGKFGPMTRTAVQAFQTAVGLPADGVVGPRTWAALDAGRSAVGAPVAARPVLRQGATGSAVVELQTLLTRAGHSTSRDGSFGPANHAAVVAFQRGRGLTADGIVGPQTWAALVAASPSLTLVSFTEPWRIIGSRTYVVQSGDTWTSIAAATNSTATALTTANRATATIQPTAGRSIQVPGDWRCPAPGAGFINDYGFPRAEGRVHLGNDLFAPRGTPVRAPVSGRVEQAIGPIGGNALQLYGNDGHRYYFAHLDRFGLTGNVAADAVIGYVGNTGNAMTTPPHLHFEVHPGGGEPVNPFPTITLACKR